MPTRNISLTFEQDAFIEKAVKSGDYQNASEAVRDALRVLQQRRREDALKVKARKLQIKAGIEALERGELTEVASADLDSYLEGLAPAPGTQRVRNGALSPLAARGGRHCAYSRSQRDPVGKRG